MKCRLEYIEIRAMVTKKNQAKPVVNSHTFVYDNNQFPALAGQETEVISNPNRMLYSEQLKTNQNNNLFSMDELLEIFQDASEQLMRCSNKMEQMRILVSLLSYANK